MNQNSHHDSDFHPTPAERDGADLLAYLMDDDALSAERRAEIEARLEDDPDFRSERELLAATLEALRSTSGQDATTLDASHRAALIEASRSPQPAGGSAMGSGASAGTSPFVLSPIWRRLAAAASIGVVLGLGWTVWKRQDEGVGRGPGELASSTRDTHPEGEVLDVALLHDLVAHSSRVENLAAASDEPSEGASSLGRSSNRRGATAAAHDEKAKLAKPAAPARPEEPEVLAKMRSGAAGPAASPGTDTGVRSDFAPDAGVVAEQVALSTELSGGTTEIPMGTSLESLTEASRGERGGAAGGDSARTLSSKTHAEMSEAEVELRVRRLSSRAMNGTPGLARKPRSSGAADESKMNASADASHRALPPTLSQRDRREEAVVALGGLDRAAGGVDSYGASVDADRLSEEARQNLEQRSRSSTVRLREIGGSAEGLTFESVPELPRLEQEFDAATRELSRLRLAAKAPAVAQRNVAFPGVDGTLGTSDDRILITGGGAGKPSGGGEPGAPSAEVFLPPGSSALGGAELQSEPRVTTRGGSIAAIEPTERTVAKESEEAVGAVPEREPASDPAGAPTAASATSAPAETAPAEDTPADGALSGEPPATPAPPSQAEILEARRQAVRAQIDAFLARLDRHEGETPSAMFYRYWGDNPFVETESDRLSTFAVDVDTASYTLLRKQLYAAGSLPPGEAIRTEEMVNYFRGDDAPPAAGEGALAIHTELAPSVFAHQPGYALLRVAVKAREVERKERKACSLVFVIDTSGSMRQGNRLELVKEALLLLVAELDEGDQIGIVAFDRESRIILEPTPAAEKERITSAIASLHPRANTNVEAGLRDGYALAGKAFVDAGLNRVLLLSDGVANTGITDVDGMLRSIDAERRRGIYLTTVGVGMGNHNDHLLEQLADRGDGQCVYVDRIEEAKKVFVDNLTGTLETVARDVKIQIEFDPKSVLRYRQLGYENRVVADADFRNNQVDAGEVGAGHCVTALYEVRLADAVAGATNAASDTNAASTPGTPSAAAANALATVRVRYLTLDPRPAEGGGEAVELEHRIDARSVRASFDAASPIFRLHASVAEFAEVLRDSFWARGSSVAGAAEIAESLLTSTAITGERATEVAELVALMKRAGPLVEARHAAEDEVAQVIDALKENRWLHARIEAAEALGRAETRQYLDDLRAQNQALRSRLERLLVP